MLFFFLNLLDYIEVIFMFCCSLSRVVSGEIIGSECWPLPLFPEDKGGCPFEVRKPFFVASRIGILGVGGGGGRCMYSAAMFTYVNVVWVYLY